MEFLQWYNLPFELTFLLALGYLLLMVTGGMPGEHDIHVDADHDVDVDHDIAHAEGTHDAHHDVHGEQSNSWSVARALGALGVGKVPFSVVIMSFCFIWGSVGYAVNSVLQPILPAVIFFLMSSIAAFIVAIGGTAVLARIFGKLMPSVDTSVAKPQDFLGQIATVRYPITTTSGTAMLHDKFKNLQEIECRVAEGQPDLPSGKEIFLFSYDADKQIFSVVDPAKDESLRQLFEMPDGTQNTEANLRTHESRKELQ